MKAFNSIKNGIFLLLPLFLMAYGCNSKASYTPQSHVVEIKDMKFQPPELTVHKGDTVIWNKAWASPPLITDATWKKVITKNESYFCSIHVIMKGVVKVEE